MTKFVTIFILTLAPFISNSQTLHLVFLEKAMLSENFASAEATLNSLGYQTYNASTNGEGDDCSQQYTFRRDATSPFPFYEDIILYRKCSQKKYFPFSRLQTRDLNLFYALKKECTDDKTNIFQKDTVEDNFIVQEYKGHGVVYSFKNGSDNNGKAYIVDIFNIVTSQ